MYIMLHVGEADIRGLAHVQCISQVSTPISRRSDLSARLYLWTVRQSTHSSDNA